MNKTYICKKSRISDVLNEIDSFISNVDKFNIKHNTRYNYIINIKEQKNGLTKWLIELKINKDEK